MVMKSANDGRRYEAADVLVRRDRSRFEACHWRCSPRLPFHNLSLCESRL
jgi:hypothetical protein